MSLRAPETVEYDESSSEVDSIVQRQWVRVGAENAGAKAAAREKRSGSDICIMVMAGLKDEVRPDQPVNVRCPLTLFGVCRVAGCLPRIFTLFMRANGSQSATKKKKISKFIGRLSLICTQAIELGLSSEEGGGCRQAPMGVMM